MRRLTLYILISHSFRREPGRRGSGRQPPQHCAAWIPEYWSLSTSCGLRSVHGTLCSAQSTQPE
jgi:hypothetical protein